MDAPPDRDRIIEVATRLFAALGFDGTTLQLIADTAGTDVASVRQAAGGMTDLYRTVMRQAYEAEQAALEEVLVTFTPTREGVNRLLDAYLDFYVAHPDLLGLWLHRRTGDAADVDDLEDRYVRSRLSGLVEIFQEFAPGDVNLELAIWTVPWVISGFLGHGVVHSDPGRSPRRLGETIPADDVEEFRIYLHTLMARMLPFPQEVEERSMS
ncbi:TetR/AcrR family transcriptional regulator [Actinomadura hibisca]|uniref:TetR/AcrR family transcriptional regulator n=1 Tax=Actinomadura hibisca TaxID=68565 RepID=UPI00082D2E23|nr:TetR/AcrR family transcriptional regulator [Actinomadura hibisca]